MGIGLIDLDFLGHFPTVSWDDGVFKIIIDPLLAGGKTSSRALLGGQWGMKQFAGVILHLQVSLLTLPMLHTELTHGILLGDYKA